MKFGISAGVLVVQNKRVLLVHHQETGQYDFWVPPGGKLLGEESIFAGAQREAPEETGLMVTPERIAYIQEFVEPGYHFSKFFIYCPTYTGELSLENRDADESFLVEAQFFARAQLQELTVHPEILKDQFWDDLKAGFPQTRYLGLERIEI
jgi:ADP-ribose pyrophosphatase YjhB (NUDIX family)